MRHESSRGFSVLELTIAAGIAVAMALVCAAMAKSAFAAFSSTAARFRDASTVARLTQLWQSDEDIAWSIFTPPNDVLGAANSDGHELDFYARDEQQHDTFWAYTYDASTHTITRYVYASPGSRAVPHETFANITAFSAHTYPLTALGDATSPLYSPLSTGLSLKDGSVQFFPSTAPWVAGGNQITDVRVTGAQRAQELHLSTQSAPSGYTVVFNYTPAPTPSASPAIAVWPPAIRFAAAGSGTLAFANAYTHDIAAALNALLGGGVALAAGGCTAEAFNVDGNGNLTTHLPPGSSDPWGGGYHVDTSGCYNNAQFVVHENSINVFFGDNTSESTCGTYIRSGAWFPGTARGPTAAQFFAAGSTATNGNCAESFQDSNGSTVTAHADVLMPCSAENGVCTLTVDWDDSGQCDPQLGGNAGGLGAGHLIASPSAAAIVSPSADGSSFTVTRIGAGTITITEDEKYQNKPVAGGFRTPYLCKTSYKSIGTIVIPYVP